MDGTLSDLKVVEYSTGVSGAMCAKALADFGADIIKVEPSEGDASRQIGPFPDEAANPEASGQFIYLNANKKGVTLDLRSPEARQQMGRLLANADIFVTDLSPTAADAFGLSYRALGEAHHRLICTYVTPFGNTGPYKDYQGTDLIVWHMGGAWAGRRLHSR
ncbi:MAG: CoA transferase [SAR202 cluster bacterium]|nr:CoA transferase [SAR202 cluster bacterium]